MNIKRIKSKAFHPTGVLADPNSAVPEGSQPLNIKGKVAETRHTSQSLAEDKKFYDVVEHMPGVEEQVQGHGDLHKFEIRLRLIERQLQNVRPETSSSLSRTAYYVLLPLRWSVLRAFEKPLRILVL